MPVYSGSFPIIAEGLNVAVRAGSTNLTDPDPGVVGSVPADGGGLAFSYTHDGGDDSTVLVGSVSSSLLGTLETSLTFDASATIAAGGGAADLACTYVVSLGANVIPVGTPTTITFAESADYALRDDQFTLDGDTLTCIQAGEYRIDAYASPSLSGGGTVDTAGPVEIEAFVSINDEDAGPAWNYYPRVLAWVVGTAGVATISFSFPQPLAEGDEIQLCARPILRGTTDLGELVFSVGTTAALMFTRIG